MFCIEEELKKLPLNSGVYLMRDVKDEIIYVGKAINLKNRVRQYFQSSRIKSSKIDQMVMRIHRFEYIVTDSELEALVLECNLIKEHRPRYNTMLKDDKTYPYIKVTVHEAFPRVLLSRDIKKDKNRYFGPYTSVGAVKDTIELIHKIHKIRTCNRNLPRDIKKERPCLNYHIEQCDAPCQGYISQEEYKVHIDEVLEFLNGKYDKVVNLLQKQMQQASDELAFEKAIEYRELIASVIKVAEKQKMTNSNQEDHDIIALSKDEKDAVVQVFFVREGKMIGREHFHMTIALDEKNDQILSSFIKQFYGGTPLLPREIWMQSEVEDKDILSAWLSEKKGQKVKILVPQKGEKVRLVELARKNACLILDQNREKLRREEARTKGAMEQIANLIQQEQIIRVEAFDISNTSGVNSVGSMVVFEHGKPKRSDYRKFKIKTIIGSDDYGSMREVLTRRFQHGLKERQISEEFGSFTKFPDLILMDGGKGQVNIALEVLEQLQLTIPVCGMVKDDNHRTRALLYQGKELELDKRSEGFRLVTRIQDEAHRFAIEYHRSLRAKTQVKSILDDIEGIGVVRRKALMRHFKSIDNVKAAQVEELAEVEGMNQKAATAVYKFFQKGI